MEQCIVWKHSNNCHVNLSYNLSTLGYVFTPVTFLHRQPFLHRQSFLHRHLFYISHIFTLAPDTSHLSTLTPVIFHHLSMKMQYY